MSNNKNTFIIVKRNKYCYFLVNNLERTMNITAALNIFKQIILKNWKNTELSTRCDVKNLSIRKEYQKLTNEIHICLQRDF